MTPDAETPFPPDTEPGIVLLRLRSRLWLLGVTMALFGVGIGLLFLNTDITLSLGTSLLAGAIVLALVSLLVEPKLRLSDGYQIAHHATNAAAALFANRFEASIPERVFDRTTLPSEQFRATFAQHLHTSRRYSFKGVGGEFTGFRLRKYSERGPAQQLNVELFLLDPSAARLVAVNARRRVNTATPRTTMAKEVESTKNEIYSTLVALFDIRVRLETRVYLHTDLPFFRAELFDDALFLSYYEQPDDEFPGTFLYSNKTHAYVAYQMNLDMTKQGATREIPFKLGPSKDNIASDADLRRLLRELKCRKTIPALRAMYQERHTAIEQSLPFSSQELF